MLDLLQVDLTSLATGARPSDEVAMQESSISGSFSLDVNFNTCVCVRIPFPSPATASSFATIFPAIHGPSKTLCCIALCFLYGDNLSSFWTKREKRVTTYPLKRIPRAVKCPPCFCLVLGISGSASENQSSMHDLR